jgi:hypothetical protein
VSSAFSIYSAAIIMSITLHLRINIGKMWRRAIRYGGQSGIFDQVYLLLKRVYVYWIWH